MQKYCFNCMNTLGGSPFCPRCGCDSRAFPPTDAYLLPYGTVLHKRYVIGRRLGEGGFGITYIGMDAKLSNRVAVKEFYPAGVASRDSGVSPEVTVPAEKADFFAKGAERFLREAQSVAAFSDEDGIVNAQDFFEENNTAYIVMHYLDGENLKQHVENHGVFPFNDILRLMAPVMKALRSMHAKKIIHCDVSPDNIMLTTKGVLKLTDFGSARNLTGEEPQKSIFLKEGYAPEEQYRRDGKLGPHTDIYALCATIYYCITGKTPVPGPERLNADTLERPSQLGADIRPSQEKALMRGMAVEAKNRTPNVAVLMSELTGQPAAIQTETPPVKPVTPQKEISPPPSDPPASPDEYLNARKKRDDTSKLPTKKVDRARQRKKSALPTILTACGLSAVVIALIVFSVMMAAKNSEEKRRAAQETTAPTAAAVNINELLSGIDDSRPTLPPAETTVPPVTEAPKALTVTDAGNHLDELKAFFFHNVTRCDDRANYGNKIELHCIYYSEKYLDSTESYISFVYRNSTVGYYRVLYIPAAQAYVDGSELKFRSTQMVAADSADTEQAAMNNCAFLTGLSTFTYLKVQLY